MTKGFLLAAVAAAFGLTALQASADASYPARQNDETDQRWVYRAPGSGVIPGRAPSGKFADFVRYGDENDQRWVYAVPGAGPTRKAQSPSASLFAESRHGDETDQRWMQEHYPPFRR